MSDAIDVTPEPTLKLVQGAQPGNGNAVKHGSHGARRRDRALIRLQKDKRTSQFRDWLERRTSYLPDLGGEQSLSAMELRTLEELVSVEQRLDALGAWLDARPLVYGRGSKATVVPVLRDHMRLTELAMHLRDKLGLERRQKDLRDGMRCSRCGSTFAVLTDYSAHPCFTATQPAPAAPNNRGGFA